MPVTIKVAEHDANTCRDVPRDTRIAHANVKTSQEVLELLDRKNAESIGTILKTTAGAQTSLPDSVVGNMRLKVKDHGLVRAAYYAYSNHHHLVIRPEDIWFAILIQFSFYVNKHAEDLRSSFVAHEGQKSLTVADENQTDMGVMCRNMTKLIDRNLTDPSLRNWIMPSFTTTTVDDEVVAAVIMMGTLEKYFQYVFDPTDCGIPTVTLLGELRDWQDIQQRVEKLNDYGTQPSIFCSLLRPVLKYMVASFTDGPNGKDIVNFWSRMVNRDNDSGSDVLNGWLTAFCYWDEKGNCLARVPHTDEPDPRFESPNYPPSYTMVLWKLLGLRYHDVEYGEVPAGFVSVPVLYRAPDFEEIPCKLLAGFVGFEEIAHAAHAVDYPTDTSEDSEDQQNAARPRGNPKTSLLGSISQIMRRLCGPSSGPRDPPKELGSVVSSGKGESAIGPEAINARGEPDTLKPVTAWWMYRLPAGKGEKLQQPTGYDIATIGRGNVFSEQ